MISSLWFSSTIRSAILISTCVGPVRCGSFHIRSNSSVNSFSSMRTCPNIVLPNPQFCLSQRIIFAAAHAASVLCPLPAMYVLAMAQNQYVFPLGFWPAASWLPLEENRSMVGCRGSHVEHLCIWETCTPLWSCKSPIKPYPAVGSSGHSPFVRPTAALIAKIIQAAHIYNFPETSNLGVASFLYPIMLRSM